MNMLAKELTFIQENLTNIDKQNLSVSKVSVGWHLDHSLKVINAVLGVLHKSDPKEYKRSFNFLRTMVFLKGAFPRGKAKSPKRVLPPEIILKEDIEKQLKLAEDNLKIIPKISDKQHFSHPLFKQLNKKQTLQFLKLHTQHHFKIIEDIVK
ncbi:DUF1569 domain-containing protein [Polaribacter sp. R77954]|uniref:DUF1569 domain-containing protein n=1 Tax=Polaribacter sp. R77954 TaxID=3093870 RepID=UPI0037C50E16